MRSCASSLRKLALRVFTITALTIALVLAAYAQEARPGPDTSAAASTTDVTQESNVRLTEIVVTAQRREENLQRTAIAVSAVGGKELVNAGVSDVTNLSKLVPALEVQPSVGTATNFYIRGVGSFAANAFTENPIAFNFNGGQHRAPGGAARHLLRS